MLLVWSMLGVGGPSVEGYLHETSLAALGEVIGDGAALCVGVIGYRKQEHRSLHPPLLVQIISIFRRSAVLPYFVPLGPLVDGFLHIILLLQYKYLSPFIRIYTIYTLGILLDAQTNPVDSYNTGTFTVFLLSQLVKAIYILPFIWTNPIDSYNMDTFRCPHVFASYHLHRPVPVSSDEMHMYQPFWGWEAGSKLV